MSSSTAAATRATCQQRRKLVTLPDQRPCQSPVTRIRGDNGASDVDMYVICITDPANFVASTVDTTSWDTQLWLFRCDGTGVVHNDDAVGHNCASIAH
jgi:hypothetical protein